MSPRLEAYAFRIWRFAEPLAWNCTIGEIAEGTGIHGPTIGHVCNVKDWRRRLRTSERDDEAYRWVQGHAVGIVQEDLFV